MLQSNSQGISAAEFRRELRALKANKILTTCLESDEALNKALNENKFGCLCMQAGKYDAAKQHLIESHSKLSTLNLPVTNILMNLGNLYSQLKDFEKAEQYYQEVINNSPYSIQANFGQQSMVWSSRLNSYSAFVDAHTNLACLLANQGKLQESYKYCIKAIDMNPLNFEAQINFGDLLRQLGRKEEAIKHTWSQIVRFTNVLLPDYQQPQPINCSLVTSDKNKEGGLNILCVKWGKKYGPDYVNKLYAGIKKHTTLEFEFVCLTDDPTGLEPGIKILELEGGWTGWWGKATLFSIDLKGRMFYIDLDMIITGNIDEILSYQGVFGILRTDEIACEKTNKNGYNSSLMAWNNNDVFLPVYKELHANTQNIHKFIVRFDFWLEMMIENADFLQEKFPTQISDYVQECQSTLPENTRIVCFPRTPKPHDANAPWIKDHW